MVKRRKVGKDVAENTICDEKVDCRGGGTALANARKSSKGKADDPTRTVEVMIVTVKMFNGSYDVLGETDGVECKKNKFATDARKGCDKVEE